MSDLVQDILIGFLLPPVSGYAWMLAFKALGWRASGAVSGWLSSSVSLMIISPFQHDWGMFACAAASFATALAVWWWKRKRRDRAPKMYGAKSRALVAALVRRAREAAKPRPVLRPVPGGAR